MKLPKGIQIRGKSYLAYVTVNGKPVRRVVGTVGCATGKELVARREELEKEILNPTPVPAPETPGVTCAELWEAYKKDCRTRDVRRIDRLTLAWKHLEPVFGSKSAASVKPTDIAGYVTMRRDAGMSRATCNRELAILKAAFRHGARLELIEKIPMFPRKLKEAKPRQGFVEEAQYKTLLGNAREPWLRCFVGLGFNFGMRKGELLALRRRDVDLLEGWLTVADSKNGDSRRIKLTQETSGLLAQCVHGKNENDYILTRPDGAKVAQPRKDWYSLCARCGLGKFITEDRDGKKFARYEGLQMHDLRRSAARRLVKRGVS
jgi:integrase